MLSKEDSEIFIMLYMYMYIVHLEDLAGVQSMEHRQLDTLENPPM